MILDHRPHRLQYQVTTPGYEDDNGDYHEGKSRYVGCIPCRHVPNGKAEEREFEDGVVRKYSAVIRLDADCREFAIGDKIKLSLLGGIELEYKVKGFHRYQRCTKLWV